MADFPELALPGDDRTCWAISTFSAWGLGPGWPAAFVSGAWPATNRALFVPIRVPVTVTVCKMATGTGTGTTGNFDLGIYDAGGNRIVSSGTQAKTTASSERIVDVTDTRLLPGFYYLAMSTDGTQNYMVGNGLQTNAAHAKMAGLREAASSFVLPATVTFATASSAVLPLIAAYLRND